MVVEEVVDERVPPHGDVRHVARVRVNIGRFGAQLFVHLVDAVLGLEVERERVEVLVRVGLSAWWCSCYGGLNAELRGLLRRRHAVLLLWLKVGVRLRVVLGLTHEHHVVLLLLLLRVQHGLLLLLGLRRHHSHLVLLGWRRHELLLRLLLLLVHVGRWMGPLLLLWWLAVLLLLLEVGLVLVLLLGLHAAVHYELVADNANLVLGWLWRPRVGVGFIFLNKRRIN